jgi:hypothetical protein
LLVMLGIGQRSRRSQESKQQKCGAYFNVLHGLDLIRISTCRMRIEGQEAINHSVGSIYRRVECDVISVTEGLRQDVAKVQAKGLARFGLGTQSMCRGQ